MGEEKIYTVDEVMRLLERLLPGEWVRTDNPIFVEAKARVRAAIVEASKKSRFTPKQVLEIVNICIKGWESPWKGRTIEELPGEGTCKFYPRFCAYPCPKEDFQTRDYCTSAYMKWAHCIGVADSEADYP